MTGNRGGIRVGIGGWVYPPWRGAFYPAGLPQAQELAHASRHLTAIEINGTFYNSGRPDSFRKWHRETPDNFVFSLKGPRFLTHRGELASAEPYVQRFFDSGFLELGPKLGPILWQFAPFTPFHAEDERDQPPSRLAARDKSAGASQVRSTRGCHSKSDLRDQLSRASLQSFDPCKSSSASPAPDRLQAAR